MEFKREFLWEKSDNVYSYNVYNLYLNSYTFFLPTSS